MYLAQRLVFYRQLATALKAGLPIERSLASLQGATRSPMKEAVGIARRLVAGGASLHEAMRRASARHAVFLRGELAVIHAGEQTGMLAEHVSLIAGRLEAERSLQLDLMPRLFYPVATLYVSVLLGPVGTLVSQGTGGYLARCLPGLLGLTALLVGGLALWRSPGLSPVWQALPVIGGMRRKAVCVSVASTLALAFQAGLDLATALRLAAEGTGDRRYADALLQAARKVERGSEVAQALSVPRGLFPELLVQLVRTGESTGKLDDLLERQARTWHDELISQSKMLVRVVGVLALLLSAGGVTGQLLTAYRMPRV